MAIRVKILKKNRDIQTALEFRASIMSRAFGIDPKLDSDQWDESAYHIVARDHDRVVGYYRAIVDNPLGFYTESEFDISGLNLERNRILEIGRAAVDPEFRNPAIVPLLWGRVIELAQNLDCQWVMGAASIRPAECNIYMARDHWQNCYHYNQHEHAVPLNPYQETSITTELSIPKLLQVYERLGARVVSDPGWDPVFQTADVVTLLDLEQINQRWLDRLI
jgi:putative hemolysin